eukprot:jgi/Chlat1/6768/Chrsp50S00504
MAPEVEVLVDEELAELEAALLAAEAEAAKVENALQRKRRTEEQQEDNNDHRRQVIKDVTNVIVVKPPPPPKRQLSAGLKQLLEQKLPPACSLPFIRFNGKIAYAQTASEASELAAELLTEVKHAEAVGFDIEWCVTYQRGEQPRAALLQICLNQQQHSPLRSVPVCYLFHLTHCGVPKDLRTFLETSPVLKVGVKAINDAHKLYRDYNVQVAAVCELADYARRRLDRHKSARWGLDALAREILCAQVDKTSRMCNWEALPLSREQQQYAAVDAWTSLLLYKELSQLPEIHTPAHCLELQFAIAAENTEARTRKALTACANLHTSAIHPAAINGNNDNDDTNTNTTTTNTNTSNSNTNSNPCVNICSTSTYLQPAKLEVHRLHNECKYRAEVIADVRRIRVNTVHGYLSEAIDAGLPYDWDLLQMSDELLSATELALIQEYTSTTTTDTSTDLTSLSSIMDDALESTIDDIPAFWAYMTALKPGKLLARLLTLLPTPVKQLVSYGQVSVTVAHLKRLFCAKHPHVVNVGDTSEEQQQEGVETMGSDAVS